MDKRVVKENSTEDEDGTVEVLQFWLVNDWGQDEVAGHDDHYAG